MDGICSALSFFIRDNAAGVYTVLYEDELLDALPENVRNRDTLEAALKILTADGCAEVRYARGNTFCIKFLKDYSPHKIEACGNGTAETEVRERRALPIALFLFLCAFLGGLIGGALGALF